MVDLKKILSEEKTLQQTDSSKLSEYAGCARKFFFHYVLGWQSDVKENALVFGHAWHKAMEFLLLNGYKQVDAAFQCFLEEYRKEFCAETDDQFEPKSPRKALEALKGYVKKYEEHDAEQEVLDTEIGFVVPLFNGLKVCGRIDSVVKSSIGLQTLDHKTGSRFSQAWVDAFELSFQTFIYTHALMILYGPALGVSYNGAFFYKSKPCEFERIPVWKDDKQIKMGLGIVEYWASLMQGEIERLRNNLDRHVEEPVFSLFIPNTGNCTKYNRTCAYMQFCKHWSNPLQRLQRVPVGFKQEYWNPFEKPVNKMLEVSK